MKDLGTHAQCLRKGGRAQWHYHKLLKINSIIGMCTTIQNIHHGHGQDIRLQSTNITIQRHAQRSGRSPCAGQGYPKNSIRTQIRFVARPVQINHDSVNLLLLVNRHAFQFRRDTIVDMSDGPQDSLAHVHGRIVVPQFDRFVNARRGPRRNGRPSGATVRGQYVHFHGGIPTGIENLSGKNVLNNRHGLRV